MERNYTEMLKQHNLVVTPQRLAIIKEIDECGHIDIDHLYENIKHSFPSISLATVYKNIGSMQEKNLVKEIKVPSCKSRYETVKHKHIHMFCEKCGCLEDVTINVDSVVNEASMLSGYNVNDVSLVLSGTCKACQ